MRLVLIVFLIMISGCSSDVGFSVPEETVKTFYYGMSRKDAVLVSKCFVGNDFEVDSIGKFWIDYSVGSANFITEDDVSTYESQMRKKYDNDKFRSVYQDFIKNRKRHKLEGDAEVIVDVLLKNNSNMKFYYLLRDVGTQWKIVSHYAYRKDAL